MALSISVNKCLQSRFTLAKSSRLPTTRYAKFAIASRGNRSFQEVGLRGKDCKTLSQGKTARPTTRFLVSRTAVNRDVGTDLTSNNAGNGLLWLATVSAASITLAVVDVLDGPGYAVLASGLLAGCFAVVVMMGWREKQGSASSISGGSVGRWTPPSAGEPAAAESPTGGEPVAKASAGDNLLQASGEPKGAQPGAAEAAGASSMVMRAEASKGVGSGAAGGAEAAGAVPAKAAGNEQGGGPSEEEPEGPPGGGGAADIVSEPQNPVSSAGTMMVSLGSQQGKVMAATGGVLYQAQVEMVEKRKAIISQVRMMNFLGTMASFLVLWFVQQGKEVLLNTTPGVLCAAAFVFFGYAYYLTLQRPVVRIGWAS